MNKRMAQTLAIRLGGQAEQAFSSGSGLYWAVNWKGIHILGEDYGDGRYELSLGEGAEPVYVAPNVDAIEAACREHVSPKISRSVPYP